MAKERLSKLQKWILKSIYLKTVLRQLPENWNKTRGMLHAEKQNRDIKRIEYYNNNFFQVEIFLNYFNLNLSYKQCLCNYREKFTTDNTYKKALITVSRSLDLLKQRGYVEIVYQGNLAGDIWQVIKLTYKGNNKVKQFLNVSN